MGNLGGEDLQSGRRYPLRITLPIRGPPRLAFGTAKSSGVGAIGVGTRSPKVFGFRARVAPASIRITRQQTALPFYSIKTIMDADCHFAVVLEQFNVVLGQFNRPEDKREDKRYEGS